MPAIAPEAYMACFRIAGQARAHACPPMSSLLRLVGQAMIRRREVRRRLGRGPDLRRHAVAVARGRQRRHAAHHARVELRLLRVRQAQQHLRAPRPPRHGPGAPFFCAAWAPSTFTCCTLLPAVFASRQAFTAACVVMRNASDNELAEHLARANGVRFVDLHYIYI